MATKWTVISCCHFAILGMFLPFQTAMVLADVPFHISFTGGEMLGAAGEAAVHKVFLAKAIGYLVWLVPFSASLMVSAAIGGRVASLLQIVVGCLWIIIVLIIPTIAIDIGLAAAKPLFPSLPDPVEWVGLGIGGWVVVSSGVIMVASAVLRRLRFIRSLS